MNKIYKEKKIKMSEIPDDLDIESLPEDVEIILDEDFPERFILGRLKSH